MRVPTLLVAVLAPVAALLAGDSDPTIGLDRMARDGSGRLLAFSKAWTDSLAVYENGRWDKIPVSPADAPAQPRGILGLRDGRVASVWSQAKNQWVLAVLAGDRITTRIPFSWGLGSWDAFEMEEDSHGQIWLSAGSPEVVRCDPSSGAVQTFDLAPLVRTPPKKTWNPVVFFEDLRGGRWLYTANLADNSSGLSSPVRVGDDDSLEPIPEIPGFPGRHLVGLRVRDKNSFWVGSRVNGLFVYDLETGSVLPVPPPEKNALNWMCGIFRFGNAWLVLAGSGTHMVVWQYEEGKWTRRTGAKRVHFSRWNRPEPAFLELGPGAMIAADEGILFVPRDKGKETRILDWRSGWPMGGVSQFLGLGGDRFTALTLSGAPPRWAITDLGDLLAPRPQAEAEEIVAWRGWAVDSEDRVFTLMEENASALSIWERGSWRNVPLPAGLKTDRLSHVEIDARGRAWLFSEDPSLPVGILSADQANWDVHPDFFTALAANLVDLGDFAANLSWMRPICGPDRRIAFRSHNWQIAYHDGRAWQTWKLGDIGSFPDNDRVSTPFFNDEGRLCVNTLRSTKTWVLGEDNLWTGILKLPGIPDMWTDNKPPHVDRKLPADFQPQNLQDPWVATDNQGALWVVGNGNLYKYVQGQTVAMFDGNAMHPFLKNPRIEIARVDRHGNTWLQSSPGSTQNFFLPGRTSDPLTIRVKTDRWGMAEVGDLPGGLVEWRLDGGSWQRLPSGSLLLGFLPPGPHEVEFQVLTERLDRIGPITKKLTVRLTSDEQVAHLIGLLRSGPDSAREAAIRGLSRQPSQAIPSLQAAINKEDFWWGRAALQECQRQSDHPAR